MWTGSEEEKQKDAYLFLRKSERKPATAAADRHNLTARRRSTPAGYQSRPPSSRTVGPAAGSLADSCRLRTGRLRQQSRVLPTRRLQRAR